MDEFKQLGTYPAPMDASSAVGIAIGASPMKMDNFSLAIMQSTALSAQLYAMARCPILVATKSAASCNSSMLLSH